RDRPVAAPAGRPGADPGGVRAGARTRSGQLVRLDADRDRPGARYAGRRPGRCRPARGGRTARRRVPALLRAPRRPRRATLGGRGDGGGGGGGGGGEGGGGGVAGTADAWSAPTVGFVAGVATSATARGQGLGRAVVATAVHRLVGDHGRVALMVDADNPPARR